MTITVVCNNPECRHYVQTRTIGLQHLGQDVYLAGMLLCICTQELQIMPTS